ncbi:hypothetical protein [Pseudarthrobacter sp. fls2-241-R2A-127]|uniref:hypothetical protein n=1 Tax=Pseudarthrobacter sp. fls2-241-R2A-127 TaxID=3040303 RepID=UPI0025558180|nr:hypothetical protein [Pseudarthrobacter sp. fls2-241-R2A-127]
MAGWPCRAVLSQPGMLNKEQDTETMRMQKAFRAAAAMESGVAALACSAETD